MNPATEADRITVLLVEDDAPTCGRLRDALTGATDFEVMTAATLAEARAALAEDGDPAPLLQLAESAAGQGPVARALALHRSHLS